MPRRPGSNRHFVRFQARTLTGAKQAPFPAFIPTMDPTLRATVPTGAKWQYEIKLDGYRAQLHVNGGRAARAHSRNGLDYSKEFAPICASAAAIPAHQAVLDGEVIVQDAQGRPDFNALRSAIGAAQHKLIFYAFDLLYLDGFDLRGAALGDRRRVLEGLLAGKPGGRILVSETIDGAPAAIWKAVCGMNLEGLVAKRIDAPYRSGRVESWIKVKCIQEEALPIVGFIPAGGNSIAALRLGRRDGKVLTYVGKAGRGFTAKSGREVRERLLPLIRKTPALPLKKKDTVWVEPTLEATVAYRGITGDGMLRHASFKRLVTD